jgi:transposase
MKKSCPDPNRKAAGIDIGSERLFVGLPDGTVRSYSALTPSLHELRDCLLEWQVSDVAMEATGVYWIPVYEILEAAGLRVCVVNAAHARHLPARKTDVKDCQWLAQLHEKGMLNSGFVPPPLVRTLRDYTRLRQDHVRSASSHLLHMEKALDQMNIKIHDVISELHGASGLRLVEAILAGERDPRALLALCDRQILRKKSARLRAALQGHWKESHLFALGQAYESWQHYQKQIYACDQKIQQALEHLAQQAPPARKSPEPGRKPKRMHRNAPAVAGLDQLLLTLTGGEDLSRLPSLTNYSILQIIAEVGLDMSRWPTVKQFTAWLGLAPGQHQSGKKKKAERRFRGKAGLLFCAAAQSLARSKYLSLGGFYRRIRGRRGGQVANIAAARKLATLFYNCLVHGWDYVEEGLETYEKKYREQMLKRIKAQAKRFGLAVLPELPTG